MKPIRPLLLWLATLLGLSTASGLGDRCARSLVSIN